MLDASTGNWQIWIDEKDVNKMAFVTDDGLYRCKTMQFELNYAPTAFQRAIYTILAFIEWHCAIVTIGGVFILFKLPRKHLMDIEDYLGLLVAIGMTLKMNKCNSSPNQLIILDR